MPRRTRREMIRDEDTGRLDYIQPGYTEPRDSQPRWVRTLCEEIGTRPYEHYVGDPIKPKQIGHFKTGSTGTHRNFYDGGNCVHAAAGAPGLTGKIYRIVDIADPDNPREVGRFSLPEQEKGAPTNDLKFSCHGPAHIEGNRAYLSYGDGGGIILDVTDFSQAKLISQIAFRGITATQGIHTYLPLPRRRIWAAPRRSSQKSTQVPKPSKSSSRHGSMAGIWDSSR